MNFQNIVAEINNAFFRLESFMNGTTSDYQYFGFNDAFTKLFSEAQKPEKFTYDNCKLIGKYWELTAQIRVDYDKSDFENSEAYDNEMFCKDCEEIMYLNWERIDEFTAFSTPDEIAESERKFSITDILKAPALPPQQTETKTDKLKVNQIALIHVYEGLQITRENAGEIAAKYGYTAKNSGEGLFQDYTNYCSTANRKGKPTPCTPKKLKNKIELFESVVNHLSENNKQIAIDEIKILNTILENDYQ
jgi:hypothetical protein